MQRWRVASVEPTIPFPLVDPAGAAAHRLDRYFTLRLPPGSDIPAFVRELERFRWLIESAEADGLGGIMRGPRPNDPRLPEQYALQNIGQIIEGVPGQAGADAHVVDTWQHTIGSPQVVVAVLDTGVSQSHPDLVGRTVPGRNFTVTPHDANTDDSWYVSHGTGCAGVIAAGTNNGIGISGISWHSMIMPIKIANTFGVSSESVCGTGLLWAVDNGARVASISLGFSAGTSFFADAVSYAINHNVVVCASVGNTPGVPIFFPARFPDVVSVGATNNRDELATFTTTGPELFICAPGIDILTTCDTNAQPNTYCFESGTSFACPIVAGVVSLIMAGNPALSSEQVRFVLLLSADDLGMPGRDDLFGWGRVNAREAILIATDQARSDCGADWNHDTVVDSRDLFQFIEQYIGGFADYNSNGVTDSDDLFAFLAHFFIGC